MKVMARCAQLLVIALLLTACVTTTNSRYADKKDEQKALEISSQLDRTYISRGEWESAKRHLRYAIETDPKNAEAHEGLALVFQNTGELELASQHYDKALGYAPDNTRVRNNYAAFLYDQERYVEAAKEFNRVAEDVLLRKVLALPTSSTMSTSSVRVSLIKTSIMRLPIVAASVGSHRPSSSLYSWPAARRREQEYEVGLGCPCGGVVQADLVIIGGQAVVL